MHDDSITDQLIKAHSLRQAMAEMGIVISQQQASGLVREETRQSKIKREKVIEAMKQAKPNWQENPDGIAGKTKKISERQPEKVESPVDDSEPIVVSRINKEADGATQQVFDVVIGGVGYQQTMLAVGDPVPL